MKKSLLSVLAACFAVMAAGCATKSSDEAQEAATKKVKLQIVKRQRKAGVVTLSGTRHVVFGSPVDMEDAEKKAFSQCQEWGYDSVEISSAINADSNEEGGWAGLGIILAGHSVAGKTESIEVVYECYNE